MKHFVLALALSGVAMSSMAIEAPKQPDLYQQSYALYMLYHPEAKEQNSRSLIQHYEADFADLFKQHKKVNKEQFIQYEQQRLDPLLKQRREMSLKQTYVRYGILDQNKDQKLTLKEFQATGLKSFDEWDKNKDGIVNAEDAKLASENTGTHDGFRVKLPISMPMPSNTYEFIQQYGKGKDYVTLGDYLTARDQQFVATDVNKDHIVTEQEYVNEFMQRFDQNTATGKAKMQELAAQQFDAIAQGKSTIHAKDIQQFAKKVDRSISQ